MDPALVEWPLRSIEIEGNRHFTDEQLRQASGLTIGEPANKETFTQAQRRLLDTGVLESVAFEFRPSADGEGYDVTFEVAEIEQVYPVRFENIDVPDEELYRWLREKDPLFSDRAPGTEAAMERYADYIEEFLEQQGKPDEIRGELIPGELDELFLTFYPRRAMPIIAEVEFTGSEIIHKEILQSAIHGVAVGSRYTEPRMQTLLTTSIRPIYEARGRVNVEFPAIKTEPAGGDVNGVRVIVSVAEGDSYDFGDVTVRGTASMDQELYELADLKRGDLANMSKVIEALERIRERLRVKGYMQGDAEGKRVVNTEDKTVDIIIDVAPGPQYVFGDLRLEGLDVHGEHLIKKLWGLREGTPYDAAYPDFFLQQVREQGFFDNLKKTQSEVKVNHDDRTVDVVLEFNPESQAGRVGGEDESDAPPRRGRRRGP
jgi:outer membrane protein assembly factor BamA